MLPHFVSQVFAIAKGDEIVFETLRMDTPEQFLEAWDQFAERIAWAEDALARDHTDVAQAKLFVADGRAFFARWKRFLDIAEAAGAYKEMLGIYQSMEDVLARAWLEALRDALKAREEEITAALLHQGTVASLSLERLMPPHLHDEFVKVYMGDRTDSFDPEKEYRASEADLAADEEKARRALASLEVDWPEKVDDALRERWRNLATLPEAQAWRNEVQSVLDRVVADDNSDD